MPEPTPSRRSWRRFSLRSYLVFMTLVACFFGWVAKERRQSEFERKLGKKLEEQGADVRYFGPYDSLEQHLNNKPQGWSRDLIRQVLGERIAFAGLNVGDKANLTLLSGLKNLEELVLDGESISDLTPLAALKSLERLTLHGKSIRDLTPLVELKNLKELHVGVNSIGDLTPLGKLKNLEELRICGNYIRDHAQLAELKNLKRLYLIGAINSDLTPLVELKNLKELHLFSGSISDEQINSLQKAIPNCEIARE